ncbi:DUF3560 domain-containing protein [Escherichia coli]|uniref:DUF3560 domain-containing protein n=1 Tax=Escherichia coli TaxID=562 RepID=UPI000BAADE9E|nr:DUF3560 domain-containing protein [Escherichia coli]
MNKQVIISDWINNPNSLLSTDTGYRLRHVNGRMVKSDEHETFFVVEDDGRLYEDGHSYESQTGCIPAELVDVTEKLRKAWLEQQQRGDDYVNTYQERQNARLARYIARAEKARKEGAVAHKRAHELLDVIPLGQPILVDHYSAKGHRRRLSKADALFRKSFVECESRASYYESKAAGVGRNGVSSDDPDALFKLLRKLQGCMKSHIKMKAANKAIRKYKKDQLQQLSALIDLEFTESEAKELLAGDFCGHIGFPSYSLSNNNAEIKRLQSRIKELESVKSVTGSQREEYDGFSMEVDPEDNRILFYFPGKPEENIRSLLKSRAFKWSPTRNAWVRKITPNALADARYLKESLLKV